MDSEFHAGYPPATCLHSETMVRSGREAEYVVTRRDRERRDVQHEGFDSKASRSLAAGGDDRPPDVPRERPVGTWREASFLNL
eukprot:CAMPEP_0204284344 /NCGR_PEP_ID=MMETSP0468-20130131/48289_1 /ASSEMBLY_ACC=CAM_ASM_000383 /TAXON_ID=2969 /ORGANISM="Oxyrrhis marina" /LENGTH=82 /DNA_ID=CAMNT_0051262063 /DNA_START=178 /DNA_END=426 /DNA_ORIENTATION=+